jgi:hypothetical protein
VAENIRDVARSHATQLDLVADHLEVGLAAITKLAAVPSNPQAAFDAGAWAMRTKTLNKALRQGAADLREAARG